MIRIQVDNYSRDMRSSFSWSSSCGYTCSVLGPKLGSRFKPPRTNSLYWNSTDRTIRKSGMRTYMRCFNTSASCINTNITNYKVLV